jgi:hypothetical protein
VAGGLQRASGQEALVKTLSALVVGAVIAAPLAAYADTQFQSLDSFNRVNVQLSKFAGIPVGQSTSVTVNQAFSDSSAADGCERGALMMLAHPGRFLLTVTLGQGCVLAPNPNTPSVK